MNARVAVRKSQQGGPRAKPDDRLHICNVASSENLHGHFQVLGLAFVRRCIVSGCSAGPEL